VTFYVSRDSLVTLGKINQSDLQTAKKCWDKEWQIKGFNATEDKLSWNFHRDWQSECTLFLEA